MTFVVIYHIYSISLVTWQRITLLIGIAVFPPCFKHICSTAQLFRSRHNPKIIVQYMQINHEMLILVEAPQKGKSYEVKLSLVFFSNCLKKKRLLDLILFHVVDLGNFSGIWVRHKGSTK